MVFLFGCLVGTFGDFFFVHFPQLHAGLLFVCCASHLRRVLRPLVRHPMPVYVHYADMFSLRMVGRGNVITRARGHVPYLSVLSFPLQLIPEKA